MCVDVCKGVHISLQCKCVAVGVRRKCFFVCFLFDAALAVLHIFAYPHAVSRGSVQSPRPLVGGIGGGGTALQGVLSAVSQRDTLDDTLDALGGRVRAALSCVV